MDNLNLLKTIASKLPHAPGVYIYKNAQGKIIYVGKAKDLRKRVNSYFNKAPDLKTHLLLENATSIEYTVTPTEIDALTLEDQLINQHKPKYNILLKEDSSYRYICITKTNPPQISVSRKPLKTQRCFGPFPFATHQIVKVARDILGLTKYQQLAAKDWQLYLDAENFRRRKENETFDDEIYKNFIVKLVKIIKHGDKELINEYETRMQHHSDKQEFEQALNYKNKIELLEKISQRTSSLRPTPKESEHLIVALEHQDKTLIFLFHVSHGLLHHTKKFSFDNQQQLNVLNSFIKQYYSNHTPPNKISIHSEQLHDIDPLIADYLSTNWEFKVEVNMINKHKLLPLAYKNIYAKLNIKSELSGELKKLLNLKNIPETVDFVDISNVGEAVNVGGVVRFINEKPLKTLWRHYTIRTVTGQDDYASITETIARRYKTIPAPDILIVDGGIGQLNAALKVLPKEILAVGLAKAEETLIFTDGKSKRITTNTIAGKFIIKGRDTVHKFVIEHSRSVFKKVYKESFLDNIPGIGPNTKLKLFNHFKSTDQIKNASLEELTKVIGKAKTLLIKNIFPRN